ncbi:hypothetical protein [Serratia plymuthica]|uniref:hypothetical protein n=1 Tax=Serratia plymuthica TaxID=82996 RepID=UPI001419C357|nr:hypothetical protein [Serratia plymuthica]NIC29368.1 hypothetical protein [Serratia plymuthica]
MYTDKTTQLLVELNKLTSEKIITWQANEPPDGFDLGSEDIVPMLYHCHFKGKNLAVYLRKYKHFQDESEYYWSDRITFAVLNENFKILWENPLPSQALRDLYEAVTLQTAGVNELLDDLLGN